MYEARHNLKKKETLFSKLDYACELHQNIEKVVFHSVVKTGV
jgi:hypothetical protein